MDQLINKVLEKMSEIEYGWVDRNGEIHRKAKKTFFLNNYHLQSIDETLGYKVGTCWEQVELARYYLEKEDVHVDSYFIMYDDDSKIARHTIAVANLYGKYWWVENAWKKLGNYTFFDSPEEILDKLIELYPRMYKIENFDYDKIEIYKYSKPMVGLSFEEFTEYCRNQDEIILDGYYIHKLKDFDVNYITDIIENEGFENIEKTVEKEMLYRDADESYLIHSDTRLYQRKEKVFPQTRYDKVSEEVWMIYNDFYKLKDVDYKSNHEIEIEKTVDMDVVADVFERSFKSSNEKDPYNEIDFAGYYKMFENYTGPANQQYKHDFYLIKCDLDVCGCFMLLYDDKILGIYGLAIMEEYREKGIGKIILQKILNKCVRMNKRVAFLQTEKGAYTEKFYKDFGFKTILEAVFYKKKKTPKPTSLFGI